MILCLMWAWCLPGNEVETVSMYMYNGVKLPALPEYDTDAYPYGFIAESVVMKGSYALYISDKPFVYNKLKNNMNPFDGSTVLYSPSYDGGDWQEFSAFPSDGMPAPIWANYDVLDTNGDVHMEATEPAKLWLHAKSFLIGLALGLVGKPLPPSEREPVAFLYNGVRLPKLPKTDMPYATILFVGEGTASSKLYFSSVPLAYKAYTVATGLTGGELYATESEWSAVEYKYYWDDDFVWQSQELTEFTDASLVGRALNGFTCWANYDLTNHEDGTVFQEATEPIPVYE